MGEVSEAVSSGRAREPASSVRRNAAAESAVHVDNAAAAAAVAELAVKALATGARLKGGLGSDADAHAWLSNTLLRMTFLAVAGRRAVLPATPALEPGDRADTWQTFESTSRALHATHGGALFHSGARSSTRDMAEVDDAAFARAAEHVRTLAAAIDLAALGVMHEQLLEVRAVFASEPTVVVANKRRAGEPLTESVHLASAFDAEVLQQAAGRARRVDTGALVLWRALDRRHGGSHYTSPVVADSVVERALAPFAVRVQHSPRAADALRVMDPAMGSGAFLAAVLRWFVARGCNAARVAKTCLFGLDRDATAVMLARHSLWIAAGVPDAPFTFADQALVEVDALLDAPRGVSWTQHAGGALSAIVGNPPWVSYAGRAAQPLNAELRVWYMKRYASFAGYRNLQGLFVERAVESLAPGGRLGFVLPSSMSELAGYAPVRRVHDAHAYCDATLPDLGDGGFEGVFQPSMVLLSTRRTEHALDASARDGAGPWPLERRDLDTPTREILAKLAACATLPRETFGERGLQSSTQDAPFFADAPSPRFTVPIRVGGDIEAGLQRPPRKHADRAHFAARLRTPEAWRAVDVVLRQTARFPVAARHDGSAFRNSLLACFATPELSADFLVAWLNSAPVRFAHYMRNRDARNGMPQVKIGHLRALPAPPAGAHAAVAELAALGRMLNARNAGIAAPEQASLDELASRALGLTPTEHAHIAQWSRNVR